MKQDFYLSTTHFPAHQFQSKSKGVLKLTITEATSEELQFDDEKTIGDDVSL